MTRQATKATENAISFEGKKDGLAQRQGGDWMLRLTVSGEDMDERITHAAMGTRYQVVMVEVDDNEEPVDHTAVERDKWRALGAARQAGIRCKDAVFRAWLMEEKHCFAGDEDEAAQTIRDLCGVESRADLERPGAGRQRAVWHQLDNEFQAWKAAENA
jgi:hypothetical protein